MSESPSIAAAILTLVAIAERVAVSTDDTAEAWLTEKGLIGPNSAMIVDLTERGHVWLAMILETPLPVEVPIPRWTDPRKEMPSSIDAKRLQVGFQQERVFTDDGVPLKVFNLPEGFEANSFTDVPPGQTPGIFQRDTELEVIRRNGRRVMNYAGVVRYDHRGAPDDVMGYRVVPKVQT